MSGLFSGYLTRKTTISNSEAQQLSREMGLSPDNAIAAPISPISYSPTPATVPGPGGGIQPQRVAAPQGGGLLIGSDLMRPLYAATGVPLCWVSGGIGVAVETIEEGERYLEYNQHPAEVVRAMDAVGYVPSDPYGASVDMDGSSQSLAYASSADKAAHVMGWRVTPNLNDEDGVVNIRVLLTTTKRGPNGRLITGTGYFVWLEVDGRRGGSVLFLPYVRLSDRVCFTPAVLRGDTVTVTDGNTVDEYTEVTNAIKLTASQSGRQATVDAIVSGSSTFSQLRNGLVTALNASR